jgi:DNA repair protein RecO (recombination protein O)
VSVLARGSRRDKSSFGGALDLFYLGTSQIVFRPRSTLNLLSSFRVEEAFPGLRAELPRFYAACHLAELVLGFTREEEPHRALFDTIVGGLRALAPAEPEKVPAVLVATELAGLRELGFAPSLHVCTACGAAPDRGGVRLSVEQGGILCHGCREQDPAATPATPGLLGTLRSLAASPPERAKRVRASRRDAAAIREFLTRFEEWRLERRLRAARFL